MKIVVCWKWVSLDGEHDADPRWSGVSAADEAALEVALELAGRAAGDGGAPTGDPTTEATTGGAAPDDTVTVVCLGPAAADVALREALAVGADAVLRVDASSHLDSRVVALALAGAAADADVVVCGDYSLDRGTGSVPAFLAAELGAVQALGLLAVGASPEPGVLVRATRRLDGGRREILDVSAPAVLSVEGSVARLRRASLSAELRVRRADVPTVTGPHGHPPDAEVHPYRPRPRTLTAPSGDSLDRVRQILDVGGDDTHAELIEAEPADAAARIVAQLREWGYLGPSPAGAELG